MFYDMNHQEDHFRLATDFIIHCSLPSLSFLWYFLLLRLSFFSMSTSENIEHDPEIDPGIRSHLIGFRKYGEDRKGKERKGKKR